MTSSKKERKAMALAGLFYFAFVILPYAEGASFHQTGLDSPGANSPYQTLNSFGDTAESNVRLQSREHGPHGEAHASDALRDGIKKLDPVNELTHKKDHEIGERQVAKFVHVPVNMAIITALFLGATVANAKLGWLPESAVTIGVGVCLGLWMKATIKHSPFFLEEDVFNEICSTLLNLFLLPILMFEAGWSMRYKDFASQFQYILLFAIVGSLMSFIVVGLLIYQTGQWGFHSVTMARSAFAYASLIAATDPVATLATYTELKVDPLLNTLVFGDSIFNDAVAIVLFKVLNDNQIMGTVDSRPSLSTLTKHISFGILSIFFGSLLVGLVVGALFLLALRFLHMRSSPRLEVLSLVALAFISFSLAEAVEMSGIIATMFCSILIGLYGRPHLTPQGSLLSKYFLQQLARLMDTSIFLLVGFCLVNLGWEGARFGAWAMVFCLFGRAASVFPVGFISNAIKQKRGGALIPKKTMFMMWHAALRGAISLTLSMQLGDWVDSLDGEGTRHHMQTGTYILIIVFLFVFGGSTEYFLERLEIPMNKATDPNELYEKELSPYQKKLLLDLNDKVLTPMFVSSNETIVDSEVEPDIEDVLAAYWKTDVKSAA